MPRWVLLCRETTFIKFVLVISIICLVWTYSSPPSTFSTRRMSTNGVTRYIHGNSSPTLIWRLYFPPFSIFKNSRSFMACMQKKMNPFISSWNLYRLRCRRFSTLHMTPPQTRNPWRKIPIPNPKNNRQWTWDLRRIWTIWALRGVDSLSPSPSLHDLGSLFN